MRPSLLTMSWATLTDSTEPMDWACQAPLWWASQARIYWVSESHSLLLRETLELNWSALQSRLPPPSWPHKEAPYEAYLIHVNWFQFLPFFFFSLLTCPPLSLLSILLSPSTILPIPVSSHLFFFLSFLSLYVTPSCNWPANYLGYCCLVAATIHVSLLIATVLCSFTLFLFIPSSTKRLPGQFLYFAVKFVVHFSSVIFKIFYVYWSRFTIFCTLAIFPLDCLFFLLKY